MTRSASSAASTAPTKDQVIEEQGREIERLKEVAQMAVNHCNGWRKFQGDRTAVPFFPKDLENKFRAALSTPEAQVKSRKPSEVLGSMSAGVIDNYGVKAASAQPDPPEAAQLDDQALGLNLSIPEAHHG